jgi:hypothetical protein
MPLYCAAQWIAAKGGAVQFDPEDRTIWKRTFDDLLAHMASGDVQVSGVRKGEREHVTVLHFVDCPVCHPFCDDLTFEIITSNELYLRSYPYLDEEHWVALKQAVNAWASAPDAEKAARFASAEAIRWLEWGVRSYQDFALAFALLLFAATVMRTDWVPRPIAYLMGLSGLTYLVQGWVAGSEGFSLTQSVAIALAWVLSLVWMIWLVIVAHRMQDSELADDGATSQKTGRRVCRKS